MLLELRATRHHTRAIEPRSENFALPTLKGMFRAFNDVLREVHEALQYATKFIQSFQLPIIVPIDAEVADDS